MLLSEPVLMGLPRTLSGDFQTHTNPSLLSRKDADMPKDSVRATISASEQRLSLTGFGEIP